MTSVIDNPPVGGMIIKDIKIDGFDQTKYIENSRRGKFLKSEKTAIEPKHLFVAYFNSSFADAKTPVSGDYILQCIMEWSVLKMKKQNEVCIKVYNDNNYKFFDKYVYNSMIGLVVGFHSEDKVNSSYNIM